MKAALRDARRKQAIERAHAQRTTPEERATLWARVQAMFARIHGHGRRENMMQVYAQMLGQVEEQKAAAERKVQPVPTTGLVVPRSTLLITPDDARRIAAQERR